MTSPIEPTGYATIEDFELRTGIDVPPEQEDALQVRLNDNSTLIDLYLGDCADEVAEKYSDLLTSMVCARTQHQLNQPQGLTSASVGATSVTYSAGGAQGDWLGPDITEILDRLILDVCPDTTVISGVGEVGVGWGGPVTTEDPDTLWVIAGPPRRNR